MTVREIVRTLVSGCVVYVLMAACAGSEGAGRGGSGSSATAQGGGGVWNTVTDPVADAQAGEPEVFTEKCDKKFGNGMPYAEHTYSGKSLTDLATLVAIVHVGAADGSAPPGFSDYTTYVWLADGRAAATCSSPSDSVRFVLPTP